MNILHVIPYYAPAWSYGGSVRAATDITRALAANGHSIFVLTTDTLTPRERIQARHEALNGVHVVRVPNLSNTLRGKLNLSTPAGMGRTARRLIAQHAIELVHLHELRTIENLLVVPAAVDLGVPVVLSPHGTLPYDTGRATVKRTWDRVIGGRLLRHIDRVIALTATEGAQADALWRAHAVPLSFSTVPNGVHLDDFSALPSGAAFRARWGLGDGPVVLFLGRLHERKGVQFLIPAFARAGEHFPAARLVIAGPDEGMLARLEEQASTHHLGERVVFTGLLTGQDKREALAAADLFALPADGEGFSMAVLEALACGLPVVLTPGCNFPEVSKARAGVVVQRSVEALAGALDDLLHDDARRAAMGQAARTLIREHYTWTQIVTRLEDVYWQVLTDQRRKGAQ